MGELGHAVGLGRATDGQCARLVAANSRCCSAATREFGSDAERPFARLPPLGAVDASPGDANDFTAADRSFVCGQYMAVPRGSSVAAGRPEST